MGDADEVNHEVDKFFKVTEESLCLTDATAVLQESKLFYNVYYRSKKK
jgi:hypothetical protein